MLQDNQTMEKRLSVCLHGSQVYYIIVQSSATKFAFAIEQIYVLMNCTNHIIVGSKMTNFQCVLRNAYVFTFQSVCSTVLLFAFSVEPFECAQRHGLGI